MSADHTTDASVPAEPASIRPPDLPPRAVRGADRDVLAGWDTDVELAALARGRGDRRPFPIDTVVVLGAGVAGATGGAALGARRGRGAVLGSLVAVVSAAVVRRIWRLDV
ncbi:hypothetical protein [Egicoccus halophilus]|uniref:Uncharacterized protein n=1 Tax=Egicoccus halophilus TaxID=1670830 RepID=A0A8J3A616_9ACTN|nr:hypothetical protein [Egicoccus halophilus]GGI03757.1 hypothetical protein GCM10011354_05630 [Egicoccus halophilus]